MLTKEEIGKVIKETRLAASLTQMQVAKQLSRPQQTIANWEVGRSQPDANTLFELFRVLGADINEAFGFTVKKEAPSELPEEALQVARDYASLDERGKGAVKVILRYESGVPSVDILPKKSQKSPIAPHPKAKKNRYGMVEIMVYDQPAAAGLGNYLDEPPHHIEQYPDGVAPPDTDFGVIISGDSMEPKIHDGGTVFVQSTPTIDPGKIGIFVLNGQAYCKKLAVDRENRQVLLVSLNPKYEDIIVRGSDEIRTLGLVLGQWAKGYSNDDIFGW